VRAEDLIPFLAMAAYIALLVFKRRKKSGGDGKSQVDKKPARDRTQRDSRTQQNRTQDNLWDRFEGTTQDKIQGRPQQEKPREFFRDSSKDPSRDWGRGGSSPGAAGLLSKLGQRVGAFFSELEQQFRMEAEKAGMKDQMAGQAGQVRNHESDRSLAAEQGLFADFDQVDFDAPAFTLQENDDDKDSRPIKTTKTPAAPSAKRQAPDRPAVKEPLRVPRPGVNLSLSSDEIRTAVVWSEILAPPIALRTGKRPWEN